MASGKQTESFYSEEYLQGRMEKEVRERCELLGWATALSVTNPVDILIMLEEAEDEDGS